MELNIIDGNTETYNAIVYAPPSQSMLDYFYNNYKNIIDTGHAYTEQLKSSISDIYSRFGSYEAAENAKKILYQASGLMSDDTTIQRVYSNNLGNANMIMQQYIMGYPVVYDMYRRQMCDGYSSTFVDLEKNDDALLREAYLSVMDGVLQIPEDDEDCYYIQYVGNDLYKESLSITDKMSILKTWEEVDSCINSGIDPTDPFGNIL